MSDHYQTLGVPPNATASEIETAYREICEKFHPEKHTDNALRELAEEKIRAAEVAYSTLRDTRLRARYDREIGVRRDTPNPDRVLGRETFLSLFKQQLPGLFVKFLWLGLGFLYVRIVRNPQIILFTLAALFIIWAFRKFRKR